MKFLTYFLEWSCFKADKHVTKTGEQGLLVWIFSLQFVYIHIHVKEVGHFEKNIFFKWALTFLKRPTKKLSVEKISKYLNFDAILPGFPRTPLKKN